VKAALSKARRKQAKAAHSIDPDRTSLTLFGERPIARSFFDLIQRLFSHNVVKFPALIFPSGVD
jgi:hypothetical protein